MSVKFLYFKWLSVIAISCLGIIVFSNSLLCSFHFDDSLFIVNNGVLRNIHDLGSIWNFLPCRFLFYLSLALNYHFNHLDVLGYHLVNLSIHLISAWLVWWLMLLTFSTPVIKDNKISQHRVSMALLAGLVFVSHPIQTQAVTYIMQRAASMATMFYLASLCFYIKSRLLNEQNRGAWKCFYIASLVAAIAAMFTKEISITLPIMIFLYEIFFLKTKKDLPWMLLTPFLLCLLIIPATMFLTRTTNSISSQEMNRVLTGSTLTQPKQYLLTESRVIMTYIRLAFLPINQNIDYDYSISKSIFEMPVLLSLLCLSMVLYWAKCLFQNYRLVSFSICWFFLTLMPESSFLSSMDVIYEHRLYLPMVGFSMFLVCGLYYLGGKHAFKMMLMVLVFIAVNSCFTYQRNKVWLNELSLWNDAVLKSPHKARPYNNRGSAWGNQGKFVQAMLDFNKAIELKPDYADAYYDRGNIYNHQGDKARAIAEYNKAILLDPRRSEVYNNRGQVEYTQGNFTQAMSDFSKAIKVNPNYLVAYRNRGLAYFNQGELTQAFSDINKAIEIYPENAESYYIRAIIYFKFKEYSKAWDDVHKAQALGSWVDPRFIRDLKKVLESHE